MPAENAYKLPLYSTTSSSSLDSDNELAVNAPFVSQADLISEEICTLSIAILILNIFLNNIVKQIFASGNKLK